MSKRLLVKAGKIYASGPRGGCNDITYCLNDNCPLGARCRRGGNMTGDLVSCAVFSFDINLDGIPECEHFIALEK